MLYPGSVVPLAMFSLHFNASSRFGMDGGRVEIGVLIVMERPCVYLQIIFLKPLILQLQDKLLAAHERGQQVTLDDIIGQLSNHPKKPQYPKKYFLESLLLSHTIC